ncbi:hypothetical protein AMS68_002558 [Peltaster fructicola]|uniref:G-patch domain-containing protein n=1 Tax=Peltaster fructicola TaxID=286661 RepID=A0A6H0XQW4_9PEZI|nr:hypothetical protein AMS68_002558 [Peltaster fructicola]
MDTAAYLKKQGWRGSGHSLDHSDRGIKKPLQISKKVDALGVGIQKYAAVSDQWWLRAYDQGLKDFGTGKESALSAAQKHGVNRGGLYARFVKGQDIPGTIGQRAVDSPTGSTNIHATSPAIINGSSTAVEQEASKVKKSKDLKRKAFDEDNAKLRKKKMKSIVDSESRDTTDGSIEQPVKIKKQIRAYIDEATRRGILPVDAATSVTFKTVAPNEQDMRAVLRLAKLHKSKQQTPHLLERAKLVRNLKRAVCRHLESQMQTAPA